MSRLLLELLHLADSALPIGAAAHSFGLETLVDEGSLGPVTLADFLAGYLAEAGVQDAVFARRAWRDVSPDRGGLVELSRELSARRPARESREASLKMGKRFCDLFTAMTGHALPGKLHYPVAFSAACRVLEVPESMAVEALLQQSVMNLISAGQRLMPLGQVAANQVIWNLRPSIALAVQDSERLEAGCYSPMVDLASMRHSLLETRLFIS